ncbi:hypothetical protein ACET3Z_021754 [Daucus carota]
MAFVKLASLLLCLLLVFHALRDSSAHVDLDHYASKAPAGHQHHVNNQEQDRNKDLEAAEGGVKNLMKIDWGPKTPT